MALANGIGLLQAGYPENKPGSVPHLPPIRRPAVPDTANVPTARGVLNSNFRCQLSPPTLRGPRRASGYPSHTGPSYRGSADPLGVSSHMRGLFMRVLVFFAHPLRGLARLMVARGAARARTSPRGELTPVQPTKSVFPSPKSVAQREHVRAWLINPPNLARAPRRHSAEV